jgi:hypothetical protein
VSGFLLLGRGLRKSDILVTTQCEKGSVPNPGLGTDPYVHLSSHQRFRSSAAFALEIEVVDIRRIKRGRRSKHDFAALAHRAFAQLACVEAVAFLARDRA